jgi:hypothetical protein
MMPELRERGSCQSQSIIDTDAILPRGLSGCLSTVLLIVTRRNTADAVLVGGLGHAYSSWVQGGGTMAGTKTCTSTAVSWDMVLSRIADVTSSTKVQEYKLALPVSPGSPRRDVLATRVQSPSRDDETTPNR